MKSRMKSGRSRGGSCLKVVAGLFCILIILGISLLSKQHMAPVLGDAVETIDLVLLPSNESITLGETISLTVEVQCNGEQVSGISAFLDFNPDHFQVKSITAGTELPVVIQSEYDNYVGTVDYSTGKLDSPLPDNNFALVVIEFRAIAATDSTSIDFHTVGIRTTDAVYGGVSKLRSTYGTVVTISAAPRPDGTQQPQSPTYGNINWSGILITISIVTILALVVILLLRRR